LDKKKTSQIAISIIALFTIAISIIIFIKKFVLNPVPSAQLGSNEVNQGQIEINDSSVTSNIEETINLRHQR